MTTIINEPSLIYKSKNSLIYHQPNSHFGVPIVIKAFPKEVPTPRQLAYFKNESEIAKGINIDGIRKVLGKTDMDGKTALVLEYVEGNTIADTLKSKGVFPIATFLQVAISISHTLGELHRHHVIHRDINNNNILINPNTLKTTIIDFGISSKIDTRMPHLGNPDALEGTLTYISPEQTGRMNRVVDYRSDLYSLGVSFYAALTGQLPFIGANSMELVHAHIAKKPAIPHQLNPGIPETLSRIVLRLLAKNAEHRYQSAYGLKYDLQKCLAQWKETQNIGYFVLGQQDYSGKFRLVEKLYGREQEMQGLFSTFNRVANGGRELLLIGGYSGIGKSALVNEMHKPITQKQGHFIKGKYDQLQRNVPYSAINDAFNEFCDHLLTLKEKDLSAWRNLIQKAVGNNGKVLTEVIPNLALIIGEQPEVVQIGAQEAQNRFNRTMQSFVQVISTKEHPLVLFLDDLQWADLASLSLVRLLMVDEANQYFLIIGAYRDNEVGSSHQLMLMMEELGEALLRSSEEGKTRAKINKIILGNLTKDAIGELIRDTLNCENNQNALELTDLVYEKTLGNAFFVTQLLKNIYEDELLVFDFEANRWVWEVEEIRTQRITDNVADLMTQKMTKLPRKTQEVLKLAACIGNHFDLQTLAVVEQSNVFDCFARLWQAITAGLVAPSDGNYQLYQHQMNIGGEITEIKAGFRFIHDRVQQAAYALIEPEQRQAVHLRIGRLLLDNVNKEKWGEVIFEIVNHLNLGKELITKREEQTRLASLNLQAGKQAKKSNAYIAAIAYFEQGIAFLGKQAWGLHYALSLSLYKERGETEFLMGNFVQSDKSLAIALGRAKTNEDKTMVYVVKLAQLSGQGKYIEAVKITEKALIEFGMDVPRLGDTKGITEAVGRALSEYDQNKKMPDARELESRPWMKKGKMRFCNDLIGIAMDSVFIGTPEVMGFYATQMVNLSVKYGLSSFTPVAFSFFAIVQASLKNYSEAYRYARLALRLAEGKVFGRGLSSKVYMFYAYYLILKEHLSVCLESLRKAFRIGMGEGDFVYAGYALAIMPRYSLPLSLDDGEKDIQKGGGFFQRNKQQTYVVACRNDTWFF